MPIQVPESPGLLSPGLKVRSVSVMSGGESSRGEGRGSNVERPPLPFWGHLGTKMELKGHQKIYRKNVVQKSAPGEPQGAPRGAQEVKWEPKGSQKAPKRAPKIDDFRVRIGN